MDQSTKNKFLSAKLHSAHMCGFTRASSPFKPHRIMAMIIIVLTLLCNPAFGSPSLYLTQEERAWLKAHSDNLVLYFNRGLPPIEYISKDGTFTGMASDIISLIEDRLGVSFIKIPSEVHQSPSAFFEKKTSALAPALVKTPDRDQHIHFTKPYLSVPCVLIVHQNYGGTKSLKEFTGQRIAVVSGLANQRLLSSMIDNHFDIVSVSNPVEGLAMVSAGQVDAMMENLIVASYYVEKTGISNLRVLCNLDYIFDLRLGVNREYPLLFSAIVKVLDTTDKTRLDAIRSRWMPGSLQGVLTRGTLQMCKLAAFFTVLLLIVLGAVSYLLKRRLNREIYKLSHAEKEINNQAELLRLAMDATGAGLWDYYPKEKRGSFSEHWDNIHGLSFGNRSIFIEEWAALIHPDDQEKVNITFNDYIETGCKGIFEAEFRIQGSDNTWCWVMSMGQAVSWDDQGKPERLIGLSVSIQNLKNAQNNLAASEAKFRALFENAPYGITIHDMQGRYLDANKAFMESRAITKEQLLTTNFQDMTRMPYEEAQEVMRTLIDKGVIKNREVLVERLDGIKINEIYSSALLDINNQKQILSICIDVTDRKNAEKALKDSEKKFRTLFRFAPLPMASMDSNGNMIEVNDSFTKVLGYTLEDFNHQDDWWLKSYPDPEYRKWAMDRWENALEKAPETGNLIKAGEFRMTCKDGMERSMLIRGAMIGNLILCTFFDITDRKKAEKEREQLQVQLNQAQKLEALGVLAGGVAHDFNNMIGAIMGYAEMLLSDMDPDRKERTYVGEILNAANRSAELTRQLLAFARKQAVEPVVLDLNASVKDILTMLDRLIGENITLEWKPSDAPCVVIMDPTHLDQILANLCVNASDAIGDTGTITIETRTITLDEDYCRCHSDCEPGEFVLLSVTDDGEGMDNETMEHIFDPFYTTKGLGEGTGLGLATVYGIVRQSEGFVQVYSEPGMGTTFKIYIPHKRDRPVSEKVKLAADNPKSRGETIVLVEDDGSLIRMGKMILGRLGYNVIAFQSPTMAIDTARKNNTGIDLFILDVVMPEMNGWDLAERLREIHPDVPHLFMSGYTSHAILRKGFIKNELNFIQKPFSLKDLAVKIRTILDSETDAG